MILPGNIRFDRGEKRNRHAAFWGFQKGERKHKRLGRSCSFGLHSWAFGDVCVVFGCENISHGEERRGEKKNH